MIDDETFDDMWELARQVVRVSHTYYGKEFTVSEVLSSVFEDQNRDPDMTIGRLHLMCHDPAAIESWFKRMERSPARHRSKSMWSVWAGLLAWSICMIVLAIVGRVASLGGVLGSAAAIAFVVGCIVFGMRTGEIVYGWLTGRR